MRWNKLVGKHEWQKIVITSEGFNPQNLKNTN